jgi:GTPase SAR1 family protein
VQPEFDKIERYFAEGKRHWSIDADRVLRRQFYELWELSEKPRPFKVSLPLSICGHRINLANDTELLGYFTWDESEMCAALMVEGSNSEQKILLMFEDGEPLISENAPVSLESNELGVGERLEVICDIIVAHRKQYPGADVLALKQKTYLELLEQVAPRYERRAVKVMRQLQSVFVKRLMRRAVEDMAVDELSNQLALPLGGSYALSPIQSTPEPISGAKPQLPSRKIPPRTRLAIERDLDFLISAGEIALEAEKNDILNLQNAEVLQETDQGELALRVQINPEINFAEGDLLQVFERGLQESVGKFRVDIVDGLVIYGRLRWDAPSLSDRLKDRIFARPRRSPLRFLTLAMDKLRRVVLQDPQGLPGALSAVLGLQAGTYGSRLRPDAPPHMDATQVRAWADAVDAENSVVLIQGPPGTGKTSVLEHVLRTLCHEGKRVLVTAPSNTAVDNICRRVLDLPVLRFGYNRESIAPDVAKQCWVDIIDNVRDFAQRRQKTNGGGVYAGTHIGLLRNEIVQSDLEKNGQYDVIIFDEAGMTRLDEFLLCTRMGERAVLFGDHQQLPPFPLPQAVLSQLREEAGAIPRSLWGTVTKSALEWLAEDRDFPITMLQRSYRCQNPRLMRFSSMLFYNARLKASDQAEYYQLSYSERQRKFPAGSLRLYRTSSLPADQRGERLVFEGSKPGLENQLEARVTAHVFYDLLQRFPLEEVTIIAPYKRQISLIRNILNRQVTQTILNRDLSAEDWETFLYTRIATVDSFQGGESDAIIICYVRSNDNRGIGFVDDPNRINVAHSRCRREMVIVGDLDCLKRQARNEIFTRMERCFERDGEIVDVTEALLETWGQ